MLHSYLYVVYFINKIHNKYTLVFLNILRIKKQIQIAYAITYSCKVWTTSYSNEGKPPAISIINNTPFK